MIRTFILYLMGELAIEAFFDRVERNFDVSPTPDTVDMGPLHCGAIVDIYMKSGDDYSGVEYICCYDNEMLIYVEANDEQMVKLNLTDIESIEILEEFIDENEEFVDFLADDEDCLE